MLIIFVFDPLAIAMVVAANMAFAHIKGVARDPKDYEVYRKKEHTVFEDDVVAFKEAEPKEELLQGNLVKDLPEDERPKKSKKQYKSSWGVPGGGKKINK